MGSSIDRVVRVLRFLLRAQSEVSALEGARGALRRVLSELARAGRIERADVDDLSVGWQLVHGRSSTG